MTKVKKVLILNFLEEIDNLRLKGTDCVYVRFASVTTDL